MKTFNLGHPRALQSILYTLLLTSCVGCRSVNKILGEDSKKGPKSELFIDPHKLGEAPKFNIAIPSGYVSLEYFGKLGATNTVTVQPVSAKLRVFLKDRISNTWFELGNNVSGAYYFTWDDVTNSIHFHGKWLNFNEYYIYQFIPEGTDSDSTLY